MKNGFHVFSRVFPKMVGGLSVILFATSGSFASTIDLSKAVPTEGSVISVSDGDVLTDTLGGNYKILIADGATVTLSNAVINGVDNENYQWAGLTCEGDCKIVLDEGSENKVKGFYRDPGIHIPEGKTLTIEGGGKLDVFGGDDAAGIGCSENSSCGNIVINGGTVTATGGYRGAGIGGGNRGSGGTITINGGTVTVQGGYCAAGIGGGDWGSGGTITINGGTVTATGGVYGAGIGGGSNGSNIGSGSNGAGGTITINGGTVTATGGYQGAGIGGGYKGAGGTITIIGGKVIANGRHNSVGVGSGSGDPASGSVTLGWTNEDDFIYASSYGNIETIKFADGKLFYYEESGKGVIVESTDKIGGKTIRPFYGKNSLKNAFVSGVKPYYLYTGEEIALMYKVTDIEGKELVEGTDYIASLNNSPVNKEFSVKDKGDYTLIITSKEDGVYTGSKTINFTVVDEISVTATTTEMTNGIYRVSSDVTVDKRIVITGNVMLILDEGTTLTASKGINVSSGNDLTIDGNGLLNATGEDEAAGIGGGNGVFGGTITINGGTVTATGGKEGAGIGGGDGVSGGTITINGGTVTATGGETGAGIGGGSFGGGGGTITINDGTVTATGGENGAGSSGAGIGGGDGGSGGTITINGGIVTATGGETGAGIGGGSFGGGGGTITINGGTVAATGGDYGAGIGGGNGVSGGTITINDGTVAATGGDYGAGIGGGAMGSGGTISINGGTVTATGGDDGAGIGGGYEGAGGTISINGGTVTATGGDDGAGIGGGEGGSGGNITISDGTVTATGGTYGAGIGVGRAGAGGTITISGGTVTAGGNGDGAGIGGGTITISDGTVTATGGTYGAGIGGGFRGAGGTISIKGGTVTATGGIYGAGIGGGSLGEGGTISVNDGTVTATGGGYGAGIGGGYKRAGGTINFIGGMVTATGCGYGAGIGGGYMGAGGTINFIGGTVAANGGEDADADIGDGDITFYHGFKEVSGNIKVSSAEKIVYMNDGNDVSDNAEEYFAITSGDAEVNFKVRSLFNIGIDDNVANGTIMVSVASSNGKAYADEVVTLTVTPEFGYRFESVTVKDAAGNNAEVDGNSFVMPQGDVTVSADFASKYPMLTFSENGRKVTVNGAYGGTETFELDEDIRVESAVLDRNFAVTDESSDKRARSTITLPFDIAAENVTGLSRVLAFKKVGPYTDRETGKEKTAMFVSYVWCAKGYGAENCPESDVVLEAYRPYIVELEDGLTKISLTGPVTLKKTAGVNTDNRSGDWVFRGMLRYKKWDATADKSQLTGCNGKSCIYGYAASGDKNILGQFVRIGEGAYIYPFRAYLGYEPEEKQPVQTLAPANASYVLRPNVHVRGEEIPENMDVVVDDGDSETTVIGQFNTRTGEFRMNGAATRRTFDVKGRNVGDKANKARGAYYGKKVLK